MHNQGETVSAVGSGGSHPVFRLIRDGHPRLALSVPAL